MKMSYPLTRFLFSATRSYPRRTCNALVKSSKNYSCNIPSLMNRTANAPVTIALCSSRTIFTTNHLCKKARISVTFLKSTGEKVTAVGKEGDSFLDVVVNNNLDFEGYGACEGTLSCSTCHLIFKDADFNRIEEKETDEERDMLDLAVGMTPTSRLGCQVMLTKDMEGLEVCVPAAVRDARETSSS